MFWKGSKMGLQQINDYNCEKPIFLFPLGVLRKLFRQVYASLQVIGPLPSALEVKPSGQENLGLSLDWVCSLPSKEIELLVSPLKELKDGTH